MKIAVITSASQPAVIAGIAHGSELGALPQKAEERSGSTVFPDAAGLEWVRVATPGEAAQQQAVDLYLDLDFRMDRDRIEALSRLLPAPVLIHAVVPTLKEIQRPFIRINAWPGFLERRLHEMVPPDDATAARIGEIYKKLDKQYRFVPDIPGMISARILATIINEAYYTLQEEVSSIPEIDTAMKLGTNYPLGPFEWCERIGCENIDELLSLLCKTERRYTPAGALKKALKEIKIGLKNS